MYLESLRSISHASGMVCLEAQSYWARPEQADIDPGLRGID
jgi:hypothetical protein